MSSLTRTQVLGEITTALLELHRLEDLKREALLQHRNVGHFLDAITDQRRLLRALHRWQGDPSDPQAEVL